MRHGGGGGGGPLARLARWAWPSGSSPEASRRRLAAAAVGGACAGAALGSLATAVALQGGGGLFAGLGAAIWSPRRPRVRPGQRIGARLPPMNEDKVASGTIEVVVGPGDSLGHLVCKYVGDYTEENLERVRELNKASIADLELLSPGMVLVLPRMITLNEAQAEADAERKDIEREARDEEKKRRSEERKAQRELDRARREAEKAMRRAVRAAKEGEQADSADVAKGVLG